MYWIFDAFSLFAGIFLCLYPVWKYLRMHPALILFITVVSSTMFVLFADNGALYYLVAAAVFYCLAVTLPPVKLLYIMCTAAIYLTTVKNLLLAFFGLDYIKYDKLHYLIAFILTLIITLPPVAWFMRTQIMSVLVPLSKRDFRLLVPTSVVFLFILVILSRAVTLKLVIFQNHILHIVLVVALSITALLLNLTICALMHRTAEKTTLKELEQHVLAEKEILSEMNRLKNEFYTNLSHEMKTPLTVISVNAQFAAQNIKAGVTDMETVTDLIAISAEARRLSHMVTNLVGLGRLQENDNDRNLLSLELLVKETTRIYQSLFTQQGNTLTAETDPELPLVKGNADQLVQVLINLLSNANRHTKGGKVVVRAMLLENSVQVSVTDNGEGIDQSLLPLVFERFQRGNEGGTGLGLSICKIIIEEHGGKIDIKSRKGWGTQVWFTLPINEKTGKEMKPERSCKSTKQ